LFEALFKRRLNTFQTPRARCAIQPPISRFDPQKGQKNLQASIPPTCKISRSIPFNPH
jgi:hypothetical protein